MSTDWNGAARSALSAVRRAQNAQRADFELVPPRPTEEPEMTDLATFYLSLNKGGYPALMHAPHPERDAAGHPARYVNTGDTLAGLIEAARIHTCPKEPEMPDHEGGVTDDTTPTLRDRIAEALYRHRVTAAGRSNESLIAVERATMRRDARDQADAVIDALVLHAESVVKDSYDPRTEVEAHWGGDPEALITAWEADQAQRDRDYDEAREQLAAVRELHRTGINPVGQPTGYCDECGAPHPCPTRRAIGDET